MVKVRGEKRTWAWAMVRVRVRVRRAVWAWDVGVVEEGEGGKGRNEGGVVGMDVADGEGKEGEGGVNDDQVEGRGMRARWGCGGTLQAWLPPYPLHHVRLRPLPRVRNLPH